MRRGFLTALAGLLTTAALVQAGSPPGMEHPASLVVGPDEVVGSAPVVEHAPTLVGPEDVFWSALPPPRPEECRQRVWVTADYMLWWVSRGPVGAPLATTGSPGDAVPGALGQPNTQLLFGNESVNFGTFSGIRLGAGFALVEGWQVEGGWFALERRIVSRSFNSDANGNPVVGRPFFDNQAGAPAAFLDSLPGTLAGGTSIGLGTRLQGYEINVAADVYRGESIHFEILAGFRALELNEDLATVDNVAALVPGVLTFLGGPADPPSSLTVLDSFHNTNHFYGGQVGGRVHWTLGGLDLAVTGKFALGTTQEAAVLTGSTTMNTPGVGSISNPGGLLVQPTNINRFFQNEIAYVPELAVDLAYWVTPQIRLALGYQFLYWSRVARPGNEIDTTVNPAQIATDPRFGNGLGDVRPAFAFHQSDFWAQGFNVGVLFQY